MTIESGVYTESHFNVEYKFRPGVEDRNSLLVIFSGFRPSGTYDFDGSVTSALRGNVLWILDRFEGNFGYYLCTDSNFFVVDSVLSLIETVRIDLGLDRSHCIMAGFSKGGSAAIYFGIRFDYGSIVATAPQFLIGTYLQESWPKVLGTMSGASGKVTADQLDGIIPNLLNLDVHSNRNIYIFTSEADPQYEVQIRPFIGLISKYTNGNLFTTNSPLVRGHFAVTRYNIPMILSIIVALMDNLPPHFSAGANGSGTFESGLPRKGIEIVKSKAMTVSDLISARFQGAVLFVKGHSFDLGYSASTTSSILVSMEFSDRKYKLCSFLDEYLSTKYFENEYCDYSFGGFTTLNEAGIDLTDIPFGIFDVWLNIKHGRNNEKHKLVSKTETEYWGHSDDRLLALITSSNGSRILCRPIIAETAVPSYFELKNYWIRDKVFHLEGIFLVKGVPTPDYSSIQFFLVLKDVTDSDGIFSYAIATGHRDNLGSLIDDPWQNYSKSYFATLKYRGVELSTLGSGRFQVFVTARMSGSVFSIETSMILNVEDGIMTVSE